MCFVLETSSSSDADPKTTSPSEGESDSTKPSLSSNAGENCDNSPAEGVYDVYEIVILLVNNFMQVMILCSSQILSIQLQVLQAKVYI